MVHLLALPTLICELTLFGFKNLLVGKVLQPMTIHELEAFVNLLGMWMVDNTCDQSNVTHKSNAGIVFLLDPS